MRRPRSDSTKDFYAVVGRRIAAMRSGRLTQEQLARKASLTRTSIINIEKGRQQVYLHTLVDIARALDVPLADFIPGFDSFEVLLRDKPQQAKEWIMSSAATPKRKKT